MISLKQRLHTYCREYIDKNIHNAEAAIASARESSQNETKSSAGDKYETAREMMQQEIDMNTARLNQAKLQLAALERVDISKTYQQVQPGSLVHTNNGNFFIAISAGNLTIDGTKYYVISIESPIGRQFQGRKIGDIFRLNDKEYTISEIE